MTKNRNTPPIDPETRTELAEWLDNESANCDDAEWGMKLAQLAEEQYTKREEDMDCTGDCGFEDGHPSRMVADIQEALEDTVSDLYILLDALWSKDLTLVNAEWREQQAAMLDREAAQVALLLRNASQIVRTLEFKEEATQGGEPFALLDASLEKARESRS